MPIDSKIRTSLSAMAFLQWRRFESFNGELLKDIRSELRFLFRKSQFSLAVDLAKSCCYDKEEIADITKQYAE